MNRWEIFYAVLTVWLFGAAIGSAVFASTGGSSWWWLNAVLALSLGLKNVHDFSVGDK